MNFKLIISLIVGCLLVGSVSYLAYVPTQSDFGQIILSYALAFLSYFLILKQQWSVRSILVLALALRVILVPSFPNLSDDIYRFVWDGNLIVNGMNPYLYLPSELIVEQSGWTPNASHLFANLNSQEYFTVYPPISQLVFGLSSFLGGQALLSSTVMMKIMLLLGEAALLFILMRLLTIYKLPAERLAFYALNPLVIVEVMGNMHFEGLMLCFLCLAWWLMITNRLLGAALAMAVSIGIKLIPLMLLPFLIVYWGWKRAFVFFTVIGCTLILFFLPVLLHLEFFWSSIDLYFRKFEFNGSIYYLLRWFGFQIKGFNLIHILGPVLALSTLGIIAYLTVKYKAAKPASLPKYWLLSLTTYLILATTVHPWYLILLIGICMFTNYRYPLLWSALIVLTYVNYSYSPYVENLWFVSCEYMFVFGFLFYELVLVGTPAMNRKID